MIPPPRVFIETPFSRPAGAPAVDLRPAGLPAVDRHPWQARVDRWRAAGHDCASTGEPSPPEPGAPASLALDPLYSLVLDRLSDGTPLHGTAGEAIARGYAEPRSGWRLSRGEWAQAFRLAQAAAADTRRRRRCGRRHDEGRDNRARLYPAQDQPEEV